MQITKEKAIELARSGFWKNLTYRERAIFQLSQQLLCMPFSVFHEAVEKTLGRPVLTHEFARPDLLMEELIGLKKAPTFQDIVDLIPKHKKIIIIKKGIK